MNKLTLASLPADENQVTQTSLSPDKVHVSEAILDQLALSQFPR